MKTIAVICKDRLVFDTLFRNRYSSEKGAEYIPVSKKEDIIGRKFDSMIRLFPSSPDLVEEVKIHLKSE